MKLAGCKYESEHHVMAHLFGVQDQPFGEINVASGMWTTRTTSHIPIKEVSGNLSVERIFRAITLCHTSLNMAGFENPRIGVAALNPHCGEGGGFWLSWRSLTTTSRKRRCWVPRRLPPALPPECARSAPTSA